MGNECCATDCVVHAGYVELHLGLNSRNQFVPCLQNIHIILNGLLRTSVSEEMLTSVL